MKKPENNENKLTEFQQNQNYFRADNPSIFHPCRRKVPRRRAGRLHDPPRIQEGQSARKSASTGVGGGQ